MLFESLLPQKRIGEDLERVDQASVTCVLEDTDPGPAPLREVVPGDNEEARRKKKPREIQGPGFPSHFYFGIIFAY